MIKGDFGTYLRPHEFKSKILGDGPLCYIYQPNCYACNLCYFYLANWV